MQLPVAQYDERAVAQAAEPGRQRAPGDGHREAVAQRLASVSTPGTFVRLGWPLSADSGAMNVDSSVRAKKPHRASVAYNAPAQWPLERMKRSVVALWVRRVDVEHRAEQRDKDVGDRQVTADVPELRPLDHRDHVAAHGGRDLFERRDALVRVGDLEPLAETTPLARSRGIGSQLAV